MPRLTPRSLPPERAQDATNCRLVTGNLQAWTRPSFVAELVDCSPQFEVSANPTSGVAPLSVQFTLTEIAGRGPFEFAWDFGDGGTSSEQNPLHEYADPGVYAASVSITGECDSQSLSVDVTAQQPEPPPSSIDLLNHFTTVDGGLLLSAVGPDMTTPNGATIAPPGIYQGSGFTVAGGGQYWVAEFPVEIDLAGEDWTFELSVNITGTSGQLFRLSTSTGAEILSANLSPFLSSTVLEATVGVGTGGSGGGAGLVFGTAGFTPGITYRIGFQYNSATSVLAMYRNGLFASNSIFNPTVFARSLKTVSIGLGRTAGGIGAPTGIFDEVIFTRMLLYPSAPPPFDPLTP